MSFGGKVLVSDDLVLFLYKYKVQDLLEVKRAINRNKLQKKIWGKMSDVLCNSILDLCIIIINLLMVSVLLI